MPKKVLLVEDKPEWLAVIKDLLATIEVELVVAEHAAAALAIIREASPAVVILDLALPPDAGQVPVGDEGFRILRAAIQLQSPAQIIVLSSTPDKELLRRCRDEGAFAVLRKNFRSLRDDLAREVVNALGGSEDNQNA